MEEVLVWRFCHDSFQSEVTPEQIGVIGRLDLAKISKPRASRIVELMRDALKSQDLTVNTAAAQEIMRECDAWNFEEGRKLLER